MLARQYTDCDQHVPGKDRSQNNGCPRVNMLQPGKDRPTGHERQAYSTCDDRDETRDDAGNEFPRTRLPTSRHVSRQLTGKESAATAKRCWLAHQAPAQCLCTRCVGAVVRYLATEPRMDRLHEYGVA
jgi:hypothetical protein